MQAAVNASAFSVNDDHGHGTAMASLVVGEEVGVARHAEIGVVKVSEADGNATISDVAKGIDSMFKHRGYKCFNTIRWQIPLDINCRCRMCLDIS